MNANILISLHLKGNGTNLTNLISQVSLPSRRPHQENK